MRGGRGGDFFSEVEECETRRETSSRNEDAKGTTDWVGCSRFVGVRKEGG
jgi:hypothetical protein